MVILTFQFTFSLSFSFFNSFFLSFFFLSFFFSFFLLISFLCLFYLLFPYEIFFCFYFIYSFFSKEEDIYVGSTAYVSHSCNVASTYTRLNLSPFWGPDNPLSQINVGASIIHSIRIGTPAAHRHRTCPSLPNSVSVGTAVSPHIHMSPAYWVSVELTNALCSLPTEAARKTG